MTRAIGPVERVIDLLGGEAHLGGERQHVGRQPCLQQRLALFAGCRLAEQVVKCREELVEGDQRGFGKMHERLSSFDLKLV